MNLGDPELELIDPTPNVHSLFLHFDKTFFWAKLSSRAIVRWSKRMYSCAGVCSYEGRGGLCDIALSEPLLKLRPRKDLIETLLHEMIHAYLFITCRDQDRDGHGPNFKSHMYRINQSAGLNISIYHSFHDEVELYQTHWWRCNGPCQKQRPHFGIVRRSMNKAPGPNDYWWNDHRRKCGGTFIKIKEPEKKVKKGPAKPNADITKYVNVNKGINNKPLNDKKPKGVLKDSNSIPGKSITKSNSSNTVVVTQNGTGLSSKINSPIKKPPIIFSGKGQTLNGGRIRSNSVDAAETVRNVWANKQLSNTIINNETNNKKHLEPTNTSSVNKINNRNKHKADSVHADSPPIKMKKIDDYFKNAATILKDLYGQDFNVSQSNNNKLIAVPVKVNEVINEKNLVDCPVCSAKVSNNEINRHLDECLNKEVIEKLSKDNIEVTPPIYEKTTDKKDFGKNIIVKIPPDHQYKTISKTTDRVVVKTEKEIHAPKPNISKDLTNVNPLSNMRIKTETVTTELQYSNDFNKNNSHNKKIDSKTQVRKSDSFIIPKEEKKDKVFLDDMILKITNPLVKIEPGTSKSISSELEDQKCACCGNKVDKPIEEHLEECLAFFDNNTTIPEEGSSTNIANDTIIIDDDEDIFDETLTLNATGTKCPCPCCLEMIEQAEMNEHLDNCLS